MTDSYQDNFPYRFITLCATCVLLALIFSVAYYNIQHEKITQEDRAIQRVISDRVNQIMPLIKEPK